MYCDKTCRNNVALSQYRAVSELLEGTPRESPPIVPNRVLSPLTIPFAR